MLAGQLGQAHLWPARPRAARWAQARHHVARASLGDPLAQLQAAVQGLQSPSLPGAGSGSGYAVRTTVADASTSSVGIPIPSLNPQDLGLNLEQLQGVEPHWGTRALTSAVERWAAALSDYISAAGAAVPTTGSGEPAAEQLQQALAGLRAVLEKLPGELPRLAPPSGSGGVADLPATLQAALDGLVHSAVELKEALTAAAADKAAPLAAAAAAVPLELPGLPKGLELPAGLDGSALAAAAALAGVWALVAALRSPPPPPPPGAGGRGSGDGAGRRSAAGAAGDYLPSAYDPELVGAYFEARPAMVAVRSAQVAAEAARIGALLLLDQTTGQLEANSWKRAGQVRAVIERLGPAYVKVAQALSTRVDLLSPPYLLEIERLQDRVPPFEDADAMRMISEAYGRPVQEVFSFISPNAVAAASLGQVYRGMLRPEFGGQEVAVKVRRPGVLDSVALDLYIMRGVAVQLRSMPQVKSDWVAIIDKWAEAFFAEMDYSLEAANARRFKRDVEEKELTGIVVPEVHLDTHGVLVTQWIAGEKLSESNAADVRELCNTLLSAYLVQLLETGFLHADPHPGNLLRTPDGKIAIVDYGLMTEVPPDYSLALVEYIAHLSVGDYDGVAEDLVKLGFLDEGGDKEGLVEPLGVLLAEITQGGGAANINIDLVMSEIDKLAERYPFRVPPYFALILRCFSVIEGIALRVDPQYAIVTECFPYLTRRLLTDNHPRARQALRDLLFAGKKHIDMERLQRMADGFGEYTVAGLTDAPHRRTEPLAGTITSSSSSGAAQRTGVAAAAVAAGGALDVAGDSRPLLSEPAKEALRVVFSREGNYAQELLVGEAAAAVDAASRQWAAMAVGTLLGSAPAAAGLNALQALGPLRSVLLPLPTPLEVLTRVAPTLQPSEEDLQALATAQGVAGLLQRGPSAAPGQPSPEDAVRLARELGPMLPELMPGVARTGEMFGRELVRRWALRVAADMRAGAGEDAQPLDP